ncbi:hypothetical protein BS47DRAFT_66119 [Hydnum rufescens UP504]|uniref:Uncharacterized protein n=1 Tax=Hydnum rufescens UP504 TaxID=1448309 RepID=A0A9P6DTC9_9AGAM|nr:hypothetical protein BS47DRAFT_66119 [Hydnum rufescens UP504]
MRDPGLNREALDTICISSDSSSLHQPGSDSTLRFQRSFNGNLTMQHVVDLLHGIHETFPQYRMRTHCCWWYTVTVISVLDLFGAEFSINTGKDYVLFYLKLFAKSSIREIVRLYSHKWSPGVVPVREVSGASDMKLETRNPVVRQTFHLWCCKIPSPSLCPA